MRLVLTERRRDERDLAILALYAAGFNVAAISRQMCCPKRIVVRVLQADDEAFPDEPVRAVAI